MAVALLVGGGRRRPLAGAAVGSGRCGPGRGARTGARRAVRARRVSSPRSRRHPGGRGANGFPGRWRSPSPSLGYALHAAAAVAVIRTLPSHAAASGPRYWIHLTGLGLLAAVCSLGRDRSRERHVAWLMTALAVIGVLVTPRGCLAAGASAPWSRERRSLLGSACIPVATCAADFRPAPGATWCSGRSSRACRWRSRGSRPAPGRASRGLDGLRGLLGGRSPAPRQRGSPPGGTGCGQRDEEPDARARAADPTLTR